MLAPSSSLAVYLADNSFLHELDREVRARQTGPARKLLASLGRAKVLISVVTLGEFLRSREPGPALAFLSIFPFQPVTQRVAIRWALIQERRQLGMNDAWIAATATTFDYTLIARDGDFDDIPGLKILTFKVGQ